MFTTLLVVVTLSAAGAEPAESQPASKTPTRLAAPGLTSVNLDAAVTTFYTEHLAHQMGHAGVQVLTPGEITAIIGLERQKQLMGCSDESCVTELAGAMGVDGIVTGSIARFGQSFQANLKVISAQDANTLTTFTGRVAGEEEVLDLLTNAARAMAAATLKKLGREPMEISAVTGSSKRWPLVPTIAGGVLLAAGGASLYWSNTQFQHLQNDARAQSPVLSPREAKDLSSTGSIAQTAGFVLIGAGVATLASSVVIYQLSGAAPVQPTVALTPGGTNIGLVGTF